MNRLFSAAAIVALLGVCQLSAQPPQRPAKQKYEVSFFGGWSFVGDRSFVTARDDGSVSTVGVDFDSGPAFAFRVTDNFSNHLGAELEYAFADHDSTFTNLSPTVPLLNVKQHLHKLTYSAVIYPTDRRGRVRPFAIVGAGATYFQTSTDQDELALSNGIDLKSRWKLAFTYGGGVKFMMGDRWALRMDVRSQVANVPDYGLPRQSVTIEGVIGPALRPEGFYQNWQVGAGFTYLLRD